MSVLDFLAFVIIGLTPFSVVSAGMLVYYAYKRPRYGLLTERAWMGTVIAFMVLAGALITFNRLTGYELFSIDGARLLFSVSVLVLAFVPVVWLYLLITGRLGEQGEPR